MATYPDDGAMTESRPGRVFSSIVVTGCAFSGNRGSLEDSVWQLFGRGKVLATPNPRRVAVERNFD